MNKQNYIYFLLCLFIGSLLFAGGIGVEHRLGKNISLDSKFIDEQGKEVVLKDLVDRPTIIMLVYYRCKGVCHPLMNEVASMADKCDLQLGIDYRILTFSIDHNEDTELANGAKKSVLGSMKKKVAPEDWRFLTSPQASMEKLATDLGYYYKDKNKGFIHPTSIAFISKEGKIILYKEGRKLLPADIKIGVIKAQQGEPLSVLSVIKLCFSETPVGKENIKAINIVIFTVTIVIIALFVSFILFPKSNTKVKGTTP